MNKELGFV